MTFFLTAWRDKRKTKTKRRASSQSFGSSSSSSTSPQDSGFGSSSFSTVSDLSSNVGAFATLSSLSSLSPRQQQQHQKLLLQKGGHGGESRFRSTWSADKNGGDSRNGSSISTLESRQPQHPHHFHHHHFVYPSSASSPSPSSHPLAPLSPFSAHYERPITPPLMSRPSPSSSSARFKAALSRLLLLPRKGDHQLYYPPCTAAAASANYSTTRTYSTEPNAIPSLGVAAGGHLDDSRLNNNTNNSNNVHYPLQQQQQHKKKQQLFHRKHPLLTIKTSTTAPPSVLSPLSPLSPFASSNGAPNTVGVLPIPADPTAPACFPGTGPVDFALKSQQLQQFQPTSSSRRPSLTPSLTPSLGRVASPTSPSAVSGRHLIPHHHHHNHLHLGGDSMANNPAGLPSTLLLRRGSVESIAMSLHSLNNGPSSTHLLRRGSVESMTMSLYDYERTTVTSSSSNNWAMHMNNNSSNDRRSSISGRSMDEMEVVVVSSSRNDESLASSVHPFAHQPHNTGRYENGECDYDDDESKSGETAIAALSLSSNLDRFDPRSVQHNKSPSLSPSMMAHYSQIEKVTSSVSASKTKSSLGQGYDISTMFQVGPLSTPSSPMA
ncbi:hypothetical protein BG015_001449 [Linnemannia schmuckeri]|uniref:Uncharacterized protein n=1 Tax=Linnemannia schmuckeri TaxID=64567 RepID=A0A9P5VDS0_9FUNG|nr:hypothetical protein BG015_001449 [Linnemannia schmuckeri]